MQSSILRLPARKLLELLIEAPLGLISRILEMRAEMNFRFHLIEIYSRRHEVTAHTSTRSLLNLYISLPKRAFLPAGGFCRQDLS